MDLWTLVRILVRRWFVVVPGVLATAAAVFVVVGQIGPSYEALGHLVVVPAQIAGIQETIGASGPPPPQFIASILARAVRGALVQQHIQEQGGVPAYSATVDESGPLVQLSAVDPTPEVAARTVQLVIDAMNQELVARFADDQFKVEVLSLPEVAPRAPEAGGGFLGTSFVLISSTGGAVGNPFNNLGFSTTSVIADLAASPSVTKRLAEAGATSPFQVFPESQSPIVRVVANDADPVTATKTLEALEDALNEELVRRQQSVGAPPATWIALQGLGAPEATPSPDRKLRPMLALLALGGIATISLAVLAEALLSRKQKGASPTATGGRAVTPEDQTDSVTRVFIGGRSGLDVQPSSDGHGPNAQAPEFPGLR